MFTKSIRFKITILYTVILALTLMSFSAILYRNVDRGLHNNMDTLLKSRAGGISQAIDAYWEASNLEAAEEPSQNVEISRKRRNVNFAKIAQRWVRQESTDPRLVDIMVHLFDTDGNIIASSKGVHRLTEISRKNFISVLQGRSSFDTVVIGNQPSRMTFRVYTRAVFENEKVAYIVQVASPMASISAALKNLKIALFILLPITVLATAVFGLFLAKATLHPVDDMIKTIHQITAENMKLRLTVPGTKDEIQKLSETFNDMLNRLEEAFAYQRRLFEDISHELKTPLTILKGEFEVCLKKIRSQAEYGTILKSGLDEVNRISELAENLLLLARFDSKQAFPEKTRLGLDPLIKGVLDSIKGLVDSKEIGLRYSAANGNIFLDGDENQLKTVFINILDNAVKYTPPKGRITVSVWKNGSFASVRIEDTGIGISKEEIGHIFDRFYRIGKPRTGAAGFGLGLSIVKAIVEAHNGDIQVESQPSRGTAFTISLPLQFH